MVTFLANICTVLTERNIKRNTKEIKCRCPACVGEWSFILQNYMKKDNNLLFFFQLFFKTMVYRLEENKEKFTN